MMVITMSISISVMPRWARLSMRAASPLLVVPTDDVGIIPFSTGLPIRARRNDVGFVAMIAGKFVEIRMVPGIVRYVLRQVVPAPPIHFLVFPPHAAQPHFRSG